MLTDRQRERIEAMRREGRAAGDIDEIEAAAATPEGWPGARHHDPVGDCPATLLHKLIEMAPPERRDALIAEIVARRPEVGPA
jgi:hypothetical protein